MADRKIGTEYVQIEPSFDGITNKINTAMGNEGEKSGKTFGKSFASVAGKAVQVGAAAITAASGAIVAFGTDSVKAGADFDEAMSQVAATSGKTIDEIQVLRDFAQEMGSTTAFSATQAAEALNYMALAGYDADKSMGMLPTVLNLAAAGGIDLAYASDMVTDAASALGLETQDTADMVNQMAMAASKSNTSVSQLGEAILTIGATARGVKGGTVELSTVLGALADNGIKGAEGGTHLRNILLSLQDAAEDGVVQMGDFAVSVYDADGNMRSMIDIIGDMQSGMDGMSQASKDALISGVFNKTDLASVNALLNTTQNRFNELSTAIEDSVTVSSLLGDSFEGMVEDLQYNFERLGGDTEAFASEMKDYLHFEYDLDDSRAQEVIDAFIQSVDEGVTETEDLAKALADVGGAASKMADTQLDNLAGDITLFQSALEGAKIAISDSLTPALREFVQFGTEGLSELTTAFREDGLSGAMSKFGDLVSEGIGKLVTHLPEIVDAGSQLLEALVQGIFDNFPKLNDVIRIIAIMLAEKLSDGETISEFVKGITSVAISIAETLGDITKILIPAITKGVIVFAEAILENAPSLLSSILELVTIVADTLLNVGLPMILDNLPDILQGIISFVIQSLPSILQAIAMLLIAIGQALPEIAISLINPEFIKAIVDAFIESAPIFIQGMELMIAEIGARLPEMLQEQYVNAGLKLGENFADVFAPVGEAISGFFENIGLSIAEWFAGIKEKVTEFFQPAVDAILAIWNWFWETFGPLIRAFQELFSTIFQAIQIVAGRIWQNFVNRLIEFWSPIWEKISSVLEKIKDGIQKGFQFVYDKIKGPIDKIKNAVQIGFEFVYSKIEGPLNKAKSFISDTFENIKSLFMGLVDSAKQWGLDMIENFIGGIKEKVSALTDTISNISQGIKDFIGFSEPKKGPLSNFHTYAPDMMELFAKGVTDNEDMLQATVAEAFDFRGSIESEYKTPQDDVDYEETIVSLLQTIADRSGVQIDVNSEGLFNLMRNKNNEYSKRTGRSAFV